MGFKTREEHRKEKELEEARKAGLAPAEVDEDGKEINPHIPQYMADMPWYLNKEKKQSTLKHQKDWRTGQKIKDQCYSRGVKTHQADRYRKGACENCGAMSHDVKSCMERPRKKGAKFTNMFIAPDEKIEDLDLSYEAKRDRWNGCDAGSYGKEIQRTFDKKEEARKKYLTEQQLKKLENGDTNSEDLEDSSDDDEDEKEDGLKLDETEQVGFAKVEKRVRTTGGGSTGTVRSLRMREDCAKYLRNLDVNSAHYDPKTRSMREDPNPDVDPNEKFYGGDNMYRNSGQAAEFKELQIHAWDSYDRGHDVHMQAAPSQAELLHKNHKAILEKLKTQKNDSMMEKYGNAATEEEIPKELLLGQTEIEIEYDRTGRIIKGQMSVILPRSKYDEDNYINNHTEIWGSWWKDCQWGYKCCKQIIKNSYCTGSAGIEGAEAAVELMMANMARKETAEVDGDVEVEKKNLPTWGSDVPDDLVLDAKILSRALEKEGARKREERDERKRKYNVRWEDEVTAEDMEAYRLKRAHYDDPMTKFQD